MQCTALKAALIHRVIAPSVGLSKMTLSGAHALSCKSIKMPDDRIHSFEHIKQQKVDTKMFVDTHKKKEAWKFCLQTHTRSRITSAIACSSRFPINIIRKERD